MKNIYKFIVALIVIVVGALTLTACPPAGASVSEISILDTPYQTTFVQGAEINLFGGTLQVVENGETKILDLEDPNVSISGYDSSKVGQQIVTVSYADKTTTFYVKVVKRLAVSIDQRNAVYFVGESFSNAYGTVVLTRDDGTSASPVALNSASVTLSGLDTFGNQAGVNTITISYGGYTDTFEIKVLEAADIKYTTPSKREYLSHETSMDLAGGTIIYKDAIALQDSGRGTTKNVAITSDMIVDGTFNPAAATYEENYVGNGGTNLSQTVKFSYGGHEYSFPISIQYSDVSLIKHYASMLPTDINWEDDELVIDEDVLAVATEASALYFGLENDDLRNYVSFGELEVIMPIAAHALYVEWVNSFLGFEDYIALSMNVNDYSMYVNFVANTYDDATTTLSMLKSNEFMELSAINVQLWNILGSELGQIVVYTFVNEGTNVEMTILDYCYLAVSQEAINFTIRELEAAIELYDSLGGLTYANVVDGVSSTEKTKIETTYDKFMSSEFQGTSTVVFDTLAIWSDEEFYNVLYKYYYDLAVSDRDCPINKAVWSNSYGFWDGNNNRNLNEGMLALLYISNAYMPIDIYSFYYYSSYAFSQLETDIEYLSSYGMTFDSTTYIYYTMYAKKAYEGILGGENQLHSDLLSSKALTFIYSFFADESGYYMPVTASDVITNLDNYEVAYYTTGISDMKYFDDVVMQYLNVIDHYTANMYFNEDQTGFSDLFYEEIPAFIEYLVNAPYYVQSEFMTTMFPLMPLAELLVFDLEADMMYTTISALVGAYYDEVLDDQTFSVFSKLMAAFEYYMTQNSYSVDYFGEGYGIAMFFDYLIGGIRVKDADGNIVDTLPSAADDYSALTAEQKSKISFLYDYLMEVSERYDDATLQLKDFVDLSSYPQWRQKLQNLANTLGEYYNTYYFAYYYTSYGYSTYAVMAAAGLKMDKIYNEFMAEVEAIEDENLKKLVLLALDFKEFNLYAAHPSWQGFYSTINGMFYSIRDFYSESIALSPVLVQQTVNILDSEELEARLMETADLNSAFVHYQLGLYTDSEFQTALRQNASFFQDYVNIDSKWTLEQKVVYADLLSGNDINVYLYIFYYYYEYNISNTSLTEAFITLVYAYNYYSYYLNSGLLDSATLAEYATYYSDSLSAFRSIYNGLDATVKAAFETAVGASNLAAYMTTPTQG